MGVLIEHLNGNFPVWLSPIQCRVLSFTDRNIKASEKVFEKLKEAGIRADIDLNSSPISEKVRNAELMKIPYIIVIGDKEEKANNLAVRHRGVKEIKSVKADAFIEKVCKEIAERI
jgi:threonyl-tRNA synthetase